MFSCLVFLWHYCLLAKCIELANLSNEIPPGSVSYEDFRDTDSNMHNPIIICVPGIGDLKSQYRFLNPLLTPDYRTICMDLRGLGDSSTSFKDYGPDAVGGDIVALIKELNVDSKRGVIIAGNSMAAAAAVWAACELPDIVKGIILLGPFVRDPKMSVIMSVLLKAMFGGPWAPTMWISYYKSLFITNKPTDLGAHCDQLYRNLKQSGRRAVLYQQLMATKKPCSDRIPELKAKALVLMGSKDPDFTDPKTEVKWIEENFHGLAKSVMVDGAGHYPHIEFPEIVHKEITAFLSEL